MSPTTVENTEPRARRSDAVISLVLFLMAFLVASMAATAEWNIKLTLATYLVVVYGSMGLVYAIFYFQKEREKKHKESLSLLPETDMMAVVFVVLILAIVILIGILLGSIFQPPLPEAVFICLFVKTTGVSPWSFI